LTVATAGPNAAPIERSGESLLATWLGFGSLGLFVAASGGRRRKRGMRPFLAMVAFGTLALALPLVDCGGSSASPAPSATPCGTYTITVMASSAGTSHRATFQFTVN
jgi:hypothetical protein